MISAERAVEHLMVSGEIFLAVVETL